jgi:hypothetical protein
MGRKVEGKCTTMDKGLERFLKPELPICEDEIWGSDPQRANISHIPGARQVTAFLSFFFKRKITLMFV